MLLSTCRCIMHVLPLTVAAFAVTVAAVGYVASYVAGAGCIKAVLKHYIIHDSLMAHLNIKRQVAEEDSSVALIHDAASRTAMRALTCSVHPDVPSINLKPQHPLLQLCAHMLL